MVTRTKKDKANLPFRLVLKKIMEERGLSVAQVANLAGVGRTVAHDWLAGRSPQDLVAVGKLARALNISMRELLLGEQEEETQVESQDNNSSLTRFQEVELFDGLCRVSIKKLVRKN